MAFSFLSLQFIFKISLLHHSVDTRMPNLIFESSQNLYWFSKKKVSSGSWGRRARKSNFIHLAWIVRTALTKGMQSQAFLIKMSTKA